MRVAANLSFLFKEKPFLERFQAAASCGFKGVECGPELYKETIETVVAAVRQAGLEVVLINTPRGLTCVPGQEDDFRSDLNLAITYSLALQCPRIHVVAGALQSSADDADGYRLKQEATDTYVKNMNYAGRECAKNNIKVVMEYISVIPNFFLCSYKHAISLLKIIESDNVRLQLDFFHAQRNGGNLCQFLKENFELIDHIQVSQVPVRHEPDSDGEINYHFIFETLRSLGYRGWLGCEYNPKGKVEDGLGWAKDYLI